MKRKTEILKLFKILKISKCLKAILFQKIKEGFEISIQLVNHWELVFEYIICKINIGAFGEVRKCINRKTAQIRAVKIIKKDSLDAKEKIRFFSEIEILR